MAFTPEQTITDIARVLPEAITVFEELEIDYSCKGAQTLADAAAEAGYRAEDVSARLQTTRRGSEKNWYEQPLSAVMAFLMDDHDSTVAARIPSIRAAIEDCIESYGAIAPLDRMAVVFRHLSTTMSTHVVKEERELFPYIRTLEMSPGGGSPLMRIAQRVLREFVEHEMFRDRLRTLADLATRLPEGDAARVLREEISQFSREIHRHMHLENNVLYPSAIEVENRLRRSGTA